MTHSRLLAAVILGLTLFAADVHATKHDAIFAALTDNAKTIIEQTDKAFGGDTKSVCKAGRSKVNPEVRTITKDLIERKVLVGSSGFFQLEVENYYARVCGKQFRR